MTTTAHPDRNFTTSDPCPAYCTLTPGHDVDSIHGEIDDPAAQRSRGHGDVKFGQLLAGGSQEFTDNPGTYAHSVMLTVDNAAGALDFADPLDLRLLAHHATVAAEWLEAQR